MNNENTVWSDYQFAFHNGFAFLQSLSTARGREKKEEQGKRKGRKGRKR